MQVQIWQLAKKVCTFLATCKKCKGFILDNSPSILPETFAKIAPEVEFAQTNLAGSHTMPGKIFLLKFTVES